jgi:hypothetical protein
VNQFVEECRSEWKRLGVPDPVADEMAADLAADLEEADAEGASPEEVLGSGAFDARSFAAAWAVERGLVRRSLPSERRPGSFRLAAAIGASGLVAAAGAVLVLLASPSAPRRLAVASPSVSLPPVAYVRSPDGMTIVGPLPAPPPDARTVVAVPDSVTLLPGPGARIVSVDIDDSGVDTRTVGWVLLTVGLAGVVPLTLFWLWVGLGRPTRDRPSGLAY